MSGRRHERRSSFGPPLLGSKLSTAGAKKEAIDSPLARLATVPQRPSRARRASLRNNYVDALAITESDRLVEGYQGTIDEMALRAGAGATSMARYEQVKTDLEQMIQGIAQTAFRRGFEAGRDYEPEGGQ